MGKETDLAAGVLWRGQVPAPVFIAAIWTVMLAGNLLTGTRTPLNAGLQVRIQPTVREPDERHHECGVSGTRFQSWTEIVS